MRGLLFSAHAQDAIPNRQITTTGLYSHLLAFETAYSRQKIGE